MKSRNILLMLLLFLLTSLGGQAQVQYTTVRPRVDDVNDKDVVIQRVELTDRYTIVYMTHNTPQGNRNPIPIPLPGGRSGWERSENRIGLQPDTRLYVNQGEKSYKFIRAENIPVSNSPTRLVRPGERVDFVAYFERIDPGYTVFDLFECRDSGTTICFNFWGVHITNPLRKTTARKATPTKPTPPPVAKPQPKYTPRTTPGVATPDTAAKPEPVATPADALLTGVTRDAKTRKLIGATIAYQLLAGAESSGGGQADSLRSDESTGAYRIKAEVPGRYAVRVSQKGYFTQRDTLTIDSPDDARDFDLVPIAEGAKITLKNIYFNVSKYDLRSESFTELDQLVTLMQENPDMTIRLEGHTDTVGDFDANVTLSRNRVNEVKRYLVSKGISAGRIDTVGYGPSRPINTDKTRKERPENRRVELVVTHS